MLKETKFLDLYECDNGKYSELLPLYNAWSKATELLSAGNTCGPEWDAMVEYCNQDIHKIEVLEFFLDLVDARKKEYEEGTNGSEYIGFFIDVLDILFPELYTCDGYVNPLEIQRMYVLFANMVLNPQDDIKLSDETIQKYIKG